MTVVIEALRGEAARAVLPAVAALRIEVFREYPYLYEGSRDYEERYLAPYATGRSVIVVARDGDDVVGASTALPLLDHSDDAAPALGDAATGKGGVPERWRAQAEPGRAASLGC